MFENIGRKIMRLAEFLCWTGIIFSIVGGLTSILLASFFEIMSTWIVVLGILTIVLGPFVFWIGSFVLYGFGRLIENSEIIARRK